VVKISALSEYFSVLVLKVSHSKFWLFKPIFRHLDPDSEYGSGSRIQAQIECGSNQIRIRIRNTGPTSPAPVVPLLSVLLILNLEFHYSLFLSILNLKLQYTPRCPINPKPVVPLVAAN
jgi:hypothetical protein